MWVLPLTIRQATEADLSEVLRVHRAAFGQDEEADLARELLLDPTARPVVSLLAEVGGQVVGHILLTRAEVAGAGTGADDGPETPAMLLGPLAVVPDAQRRGVGTELMRAALDTASGLGVGLVFVLGHPDYYPRVGFRPAGCLGLHAPYSIPREHADAWMVAETSPGLVGTVTGTVVPAAGLRHVELWSEAPPLDADGLTPHAGANRDSWNADSAQYQTDHGPQLAASGGLAWGVWQVPEAELRILGDVQGKDILELGCGAAQWSIALARLGARPVALDLSEEQLAHARGLMRKAGVDFPLLHASAEAVPLADAGFDIVFCDYGAMTFADPYLTIPEVARLLRPCGLFAFNGSTPIAQLCYPDVGDNPVASLQRDYFGMRALPYEGYVDFMVPYGEWIRLFVANGFVIEDLVEIRPAEDAASSYYGDVFRDWARRWPAEQIWKVRKRGIRSPES